MIHLSKQDGTSIAHGEKFSETALRVWQLVKEKKALNNLLAIGVNCLHPRVRFSLIFSYKMMKQLDFRQTFL